MIAHQFTAAADRDISLAIGIGISQVDTGLGAYGFHFLSIGMAKKPDYAIAIRLLGRHRAAMQTAIAADGGQHGKIDALDQFVQLSHWVVGLRHVSSLLTAPRCVVGAVGESQLRTRGSDEIGGHFVGLPIVSRIYLGDFYVLADQHRAQPVNNLPVLLVISQSKEVGGLAHLLRRTRSELPVGEAGVNGSPVMLAIAA